MSQSVAEAQAALRTAETSLKLQQQEEAARQLREVRTQGRALKRELDTLIRIVRQAEAEESLAEAELADLNNAISAQAASKPDSADFPTDGDLRDWQTELDRLAARRDKVVARARAAQQKDAPARLRAIQLDKALIGLRYQQRNLECKVRGEPIAGGWEGGVSPV